MSDGALRSERVSAHDAWNSPERRGLRALVADFTVREILPNLERWEDDGELPGALSDADIELAMAKNTATAACDRVVDKAVQLHGGMGCMHGVEVERHYRDAGILGIGGGTTEILDELVARGLGLDGEPQR